ncbi:unnamed protein product [Discula destructiva]
MSAAIAMAPSPAPHDRTSFGGEAAPAHTSAAPASSASPSIQRTSSTGIPNATAAAASAPPQHPSRSGSRSPRGQTQTHGKSSPPSRSAGGAPRIIVKKEPGSPEQLPTSRHRPRKLDLSKNAPSTGSPATARPYTARDGLQIQDVGLACLSPGFVTQDPIMKEQVQRSLSVREQQRHLIEARLQQQSAKGDGPMDKEKDANAAFSVKTPGISSRRGKVPAGLSIVAPSHEHFANERVIQSAPLGQTFTGMNNPHPLTRHIENRPSKLSNTSHIHHVPANQTNNRLPPIADVFGAGLSAHPSSQEHHMYAPHTAVPRPMGSPNPHSHHHQPPASDRPREYKSAEDVQRELAGGKPELLPKLVHYGGHQPPTPPSPLPGSHRVDGRSGSQNKRRRDEYEAGVSPPLGNGRPSVRRGPFGEGRDSPETQRAKKDEFMRLCDRAWDLFHS